jgi:hypothetical protein
MPTRRKSQVPSLSKNQQISAAIAAQVKKGKVKAKPGSPSAKMAKSMSIKQLNDFASTPTKGLVKRVKMK